MSLKIDINEGPNRRGSCKIETEGSFLDLMAELTLVVVSIYQNTKRADPGLAEAFRTGLVDSLRDPDVWNLNAGGKGHSMCTIMPNFNE